MFNEQGPVLREFYFQQRTLLVRKLWLLNVLSLYFRHGKTKYMIKFTLELSNNSRIFHNTDIEVFHFEARKRAEAALMFIFPT